MLDYFYQLSDATCFILMVVVTLMLSLLIILINKSFILYKVRYRDNIITASAASLLGIIYGVMTGFISLYLMTNNDHASTAVLHEGTAAANIYRDSKWLKFPAQKNIQQTLKQYITNVINDEWPAMHAGKNPHQSNSKFIDSISDQLYHYPISTPADTIAVTDLMQELKALYEGRQDRIDRSESQLSPEIWLVILLGTTLIIVVNYAFRVNFYLHVFSITVFSIMAASVLFLLVTLDRPFQGEFVVQPKSLQSVLDSMEADGN